MADVENMLVDLTDGRELVINSIVSGGYWGSQHVITLGTSRVGVSTDGKKQSQIAIVARLRFDNDMAKTILEALGQGLAALTPPTNEKPN